MFEYDEYDHDFYVTNLEIKANEAIFQIQMLVYNLFLMFKQEYLSENQYWQQIKTFRLKYIFVAAKIVKTGRQTRGEFTLF